MYNCYGLLSYLMMILGKIYKNEKQPTLSFKYLRKADIFGVLYKNDELLFRIYKNLGKKLPEIQEVLGVINKFYKVFVYMLELQNQMEEIKAYDKLGLVIFYLGNLQKAKFYHKKMVSGLLISSNPILLQEGGDLYKYIYNIQITNLSEILNKNKEEISELDQQYQISRIKYINLVLLNNKFFLK